MVLRMAAEGMRDPSPPLPPDPSPRTMTPVQRDQPQPLAGSQQTSPVTPSREQPPPGLKRVDFSRTPQKQQPRQLMKDAVTDAFEHSPVTNQLNNLNQLDPEFIKQVTEQVIKNLQAAATTPTASTQQQQTQFAAPPLPQQSQEPRSPTQSSVDSCGARQTPPTPERAPEARNEAGTTSSSPSPSDAGSNISRESSHSVRSNESQRSGNTPKPFNSESTARSPRANYSTRRRSGTVPTEGGPSRGTGGNDNAARDNVPHRRNSKEVDYDGASRAQATQPPGQPDTGETPLEKFWQPLFDNNGNPTGRLSQFLRGLALHLIDDYEPKGSLVVTPAKMLQFLKETRVEQEHYPWEAIFGGTMAPLSISMMFQKLLCQHHLVQDRYDRAPIVPGLTPHGFDWLMTCLIQAHPDNGFERLAKAVMNMPISNADSKTERFPKELSRRLLPNKPNIQAEQRLVSSLNHEPEVFATLRVQMPPPPSNPPPTQSFNERDPNRFSQSSQRSNAVDDEDLVSPPSMPLERERKPYFAKEGSGKQYDEGRPIPAPYRTDSSQANGSRASRTNSGIPAQAMYASSSGPSEPMNIPQRHSHRLSTSQAPPPMANGGYSKSGRRSPPARSPFARSEPDFVGSMPNSQYGSNLHPTQSREQYAQVDPDEEQSRRYRSRSRADRPGTFGSNPNDDDRGYPIPGRNVPLNSGYEYGSGPAPGALPIGNDMRGQSVGGMHPVGSFPARRPGVSANTSDGRRKSMHTPGLGIGHDGGTDGYGSFAGSMNGGSGWPPPPQQQPYGTSSQY